MAHLHTAPGPTLVFTEFEEGILDLERFTGQWTIQLEVGATGRLDPERLQRALDAACAHHPLARVRLRALMRRHRSYRWFVAVHMDVPMLSVVECPDDAALAGVRSDLYGAPLELDLAPPLRVVLARGAERDLVLFSFSHVANDGIGCHRLAQAVARAYRGADEPRDAVELGEARRLGHQLRAQTWSERAARAGEAVRRGLQARKPPTRIAADGGGGRAGYGFVTRALGARETDDLLAHRPSRASLNDMLLVAAVLAVDRWNAAHGVRSDRISVTMPVNTRPPAWFWDVVGNFASFLTVSTGREQRANVFAAVEAVTAQTEPSLRARRAAGLHDLLKLLRPLPLALERLFARSLAGNRFMDTVVLSNLGRLQDPPRFDDGNGPEVWFSPPCVMPIGVGIGIATAGDVLRLCVRYRYELFDDAAARAFTDLYLEQLTALSGAQPARLDVRRARSRARR
jgi:NRPS condensation-like uncharacterized protein